MEEVYGSVPEELYTSVSYRPEPVSHGFAVSLWNVLFPLLIDLYLVHGENWHVSYLFFFTLRQTRYKLFTRTRSPADPWKWGNLI